MNVSSPCPDFLVIGAIKSGTTWLHHNLRAHPRLWMPPIKELRYFNEPQTDLLGRLLEWDKTGAEHDYGYWRFQLKRFLRNWRGWLRPARAWWHLKYFFGRRSPRWYAALFAAAEDRVAGEATPLYAPMPEQNIAFAARHFPDLKIVYLLRDPVERIWAHVLLRCLGLPEVDWKPERITDALVRRIVRERDLHDEWLFQNGRYAENLARWEHHFGREQVFVGFHEELKRSPTGLLHRVHRFLGTQQPGWHDAALVEKRFNTKPVELAIPPAIEKAFAERFVDDLDLLANRFGMPPASWRDRAHRAAGNTADTRPSR